MGRLILFILATAALVFASVWLADRPGEVTIRWQGWRVDTSVPVLLLAILVLVFALDALRRLLRAILSSPRRFLRARRDKRRVEGYRALSDGLAAVASGDRRQAKKLARRADKLLEDRSLTGLLTARAAELSGDDIEARRRFDDMLARPETAFLGLKGLLALALKEGDRAAALDYARRAWAVKPGSGELAETLYDLLAAAGQWGEAETMLAEAKRAGSLSGAALLHRQALALLERARAATDAKEALDLAVKAHRADPVLVPATVEAARRLAAAGKLRKAQAAIETTWEAAPHPDLAETWAGLEGGDPLQRVKRLEKLVKTTPDAAEGHLALARSALDAKLWGIARSHLERAESLSPSVAVYDLLARLERGERKDEAAAKDWEAKGSTAPADAAWVCRACGKAAPAWSPTCPACGSVDALEWR
jgi:HemY protein